MAGNMVPPFGNKKSFFFFTFLVYFCFNVLPVFREKNKKWAEQGAALVCLYFLGIIDEKSLTAGGNILS